MLELEGKSFVYPSLPQKVKDKPVGARIPTGFYRFYRICRIPVLKTCVLDVFTLVTGDAKGEKKEKYS